MKRHPGNAAFLLVWLGAVSAGQAGTLRHALGFFGGPVSGTGFSYRQMAEQHGFQFTFGLLSGPGDENDFPGASTTAYDPVHNVPDLAWRGTRSFSNRWVRANAGLNLYKPLHRSARTCFYLLCGASWYGKQESVTNQAYGYTRTGDVQASWGPVGPTLRHSETTHVLYAGVGLGFEWKLSENFRLSLEWPLTVNTDEEITMYIPQGGLHYYFR